MTSSLICHESPLQRECGGREGAEPGRLGEAARRGHHRQHLPSVPHTLQVGAAQYFYLLCRYFCDDTNIFLLCSQGGVARFQEAEGAGVGRDGYWGWHGYGGSVFQWDPELRIGWVSKISR